MSKIKTLYEVTCRLQEVRYFDGTVATGDDAIGYLHIDDGYSQISLHPAQLTEAEYNRVKGDWRSWDGMPWYYRMKPDSIVVTKLTIETFDPVITREVIQNDF